jgi:Ca2+-binding EF-hand superfamily protein
MRRKLQQLINVGKAIALGSSKDSEDDDDDDYYESDDDEEKSSSSDQDEDEPEEYVDPTRCWGRFYMTPKFDHADMVRLTCTITNGSTSMGGTYGCEGECDIVQRGPKWYIRFRQFELVNVKKSNVYIYLLTSKARHEMPRLEKDGHIVEVDFTDGGTIKGKDCGEEWEQLLEGDDIQNLRWKGVALAKPKTDRPGTAVPLVFGYGSFKPFKRDWHDREDLSNKILTVQKQFEKVTEIMESGKLKHDEMNESEAKEIAKRAFMNCGFSADDELEKNEFERVLSELNYAFTKAKLDPLFKVGDLDLNGDMDFKEFEFVVMLLCRLRPVPRICLWEWFYMFSERNSGYLDYIEFHMCMTALGYNSVTEKKAFNIFSKMHKYGKFHVTYEEFRDLWADVVRKHGNLKMEWKKITGAKPTKRISAHDLVIRVCRCFLLF